MALPGGQQEIPQENVKHGRDPRDIRKRKLPVSTADAISLINSPRRAGKSPAESEDEMKRFVLEYANAKKDSRREKTSFLVSKEEYQKQYNAFCQHIDLCIKACQIGLLTDTEAVESIAKISFYTEA